MIVSLGLAPVFGLTTELIVGAARPSRPGRLGDLRDRGRARRGPRHRHHGAIGVAIYRSELADRLPAAVPAEAAEVARDTLGSAAAVAAQLPGGWRGRAGRRPRRLRGRHAAQLGHCRRGAVAVAVLALVTLRDRRPADPDDAGEGKLVTASATHGGPPEDG